MRNTKLTKGIAASALLIAGLGAGTAVLSGTSASAATNDTAATSVASTASTSTAPSTNTPPDPTKSIRSDEHLLTGDTATKVRDVALAKYPDATIQRVETDSEGVYEAHIVTAAGDQVIVQVGADFTITGTQTGGPGPNGGPPTDSSGNPIAPPTDSSGNPIAPPNGGTAPVTAPSASA